MKPSKNYGWVIKKLTKWLESLRLNLNVTCKLSSLRLLIQVKKFKGGSKLFMLKVEMPRRQKNKNYFNKMVEIRVSLCYCMMGFNRQSRQWFDKRQLHEVGNQLYNVIVERKIKPSKNYGWVIKKLTKWLESLRLNLNVTY